MRGGEIELQYENGKTALVSMDETMLGHYDMMKIGKQIVEVGELQFKVMQHMDEYRSDQNREMPDMLEVHSHHKGGDSK